MISEVRIDSGIEMQTIRVLRQLPRNSRIIRPGQHGGDQSFPENAFDSGAHEERLIEQLLQFHARASVARMRVSDVLTARTTSQRRRVSCLSYAEQRRAHAILTHHIRLHRKAIVYLGNVAHVHDRAIHGSHGQIVQSQR